MNASLPEDHQLEGVQIWKDEEGREEQRKTPFPFGFWLSSVVFLVCFFAVWRLLSRSLVWPQSALCETSDIEE